MRKFRVTVNGHTYDVDVEEIQGGANTTAQTQVQTTQTTNVSMPAAPSTSAGAFKVEAPMQGKIVSVKVTEGQNVQEGDVVAILEAMKMENEIVASKGGTVATVNVAAGQSVEAGDLIASLN